MNAPFRLLVRASMVTFSSCFLLPSSLFSQGSLTPPGPPAPTMRTLDEVQPRIAINAANTPGDATSLFKITQSGSYYLTKNITGVAGKHGIAICLGGAGGGVAIDLDGFSLVGVPGALDGVSMTCDVTNVTVVNGIVRFWPGNGIRLQNSNATVNCRLDKVEASSNGSRGLFVGRGSAVVNCSAFNNANDGIGTDVGCAVTNCESSGNSGDGISVADHSSIASCLARNNDGIGIVGGPGSPVTNCTATENRGVAGILGNGGSTVAHCTVSKNTSGLASSSGILALAATVESCTVTFNTSTAASPNGATGAGISASDGSQIRHCMVRSNTGDGIRVDSNCLVSENNCSGSGGFGGSNAANIHLTGDDNRIEGNHCSGSTFRGIQVDGDRNRIDNNSATSNGVGFDVNGADNIVIRNTASGNSPNYSIVAGNSVAPRVGVVDSDGWAGITNANHPWANFGY